jgi:two-component system NtrC family sensor kinase
MDRRRKPRKVKAEAERSLVRKSPKEPGGKVRDLERRLAEALKGRAEALELLQARSAALTEALERETATGDILRIISRAPTDLQPVLDAIARRAARLCAANDVVILRRDGDALRRAAHHGPIPAPLGGVVPLIRSTVGGRSVLDGHTIQVVDARAETKEFPGTSALAQEHGFHTLLSVPLLRDGVAIGSLILRRAEVQPFTETQRTLLQTFADQAVIAIENVRLFTELQASNRDLAEALEQQTATSEVLKVISRSTFELEPVLEALVENAATLCGAEWGTIYRVDGELLHVAAFYRASSEFREFWQQVELRPGRGSCAGRAALERRTGHLPDALADPEYEMAEA